MTKEEYYALYNQPVKVKCIDCGTEFDISRSAYNSKMRRSQDNPQFRCKACVKLHRKKLMTDRMANMTQEEKDEMYKKVSDKKKDFWKNVPKEQREKILGTLNSASKNWRENETEEERLRISQMKSESNKRRWESMTKEEREVFIKKSHDAWREKVDLKKFGNDIRLRWKSMTPYQLKELQNKISNGKRLWWTTADPEKLQKMKDKISGTVYQYWKSLPETERDKIAERERLRWESLSDEDKKAISMHMADVSAERWKVLDPATQQHIINSLNAGHSEYWQNMSDEERERISEEYRQRSIEYWNSLPDTEKELVSLREKERWANMPIYSKEELTKRKLSTAGAKKVNAFASKFESKFNSIFQNLFFVKEYPCSENGIIHFWDYGIFDENGDLVMVVDLDGAYFHGDNTDYDGMHSREEYDEKRWMTIPENTMHAIILESAPDKSFKQLETMLYHTFDSWCMYIFKSIRTQPFPYPHHTKSELLRSYDKLKSMNPNDKYHKDLSLNTRQGDWLAMEFHQSIWHDHRDGELSPYDVWNDDNMLMSAIKSHQIYQTFLNPNKMLQGFNFTRVQFMSGGRAKMIISRYLNEFDTIFDPFSGYSGRMLGTISSGKRYIGQDISERFVRESNELLEFLKKYAVIFDATVMHKDIMQSSGEYQCLFTCPPSDDMIDICLERFKCRRYVFVVDMTEKYQSHIASVIRSRSSINQKDSYIIVL